MVCNGLSGTWPILKCPLSINGALTPSDDGRIAAGNRFHVLHCVGYVFRVDLDIAQEKTRDVDVD